MLNMSSEFSKTWRTYIKFIKTLLRLRVFFPYIVVMCSSHEGDHSKLTGLMSI